MPCIFSGMACKIMASRPRCTLVLSSCRWKSTSYREIEEVSLSTNTQEELADVMRPSYELQSPVVVRGAVSDAPAIKLWQSLPYWYQSFDKEDQFGGVEIGGSYGSNDMERAEIPLQGYLQYLELFEERHGRTGPDDPLEIPTSIPIEELVYMAQNDLFPSLYKDIRVPRFCEDQSDGVGNGRLYSVMLWLGPRGCVSPLHFDPLDNCLMQFVGRKKIWLYEPQAGGWHYAGHNDQQSNTSPVNPEDVNGDQYPLFAQEAPPKIQCVLNPGDLLYIPSKWWHFVRSLDTSASVNVWWR